MQALLQMQGISGADDCERWVKMITALDLIYVGYVNNKLRIERDRATKSSKRR